jgi:putative membrane protein
MGIGMIVLVVAAVVVVVYLIRSMTVATAQTHPPAQYSPAETPRDIVQRRYASGEIDREEYLQKLKDL